MKKYMPREMTGNYFTLKLARTDGEAAGELKFEVTLIVKSKGIEIKKEFETLEDATDEFEEQIAKHRFTNNWEKAKNVSK
jgi:hypothetical protein